MKYKQWDKVKLLKSIPWFKKGIIWEISYNWTDIWFIDFYKKERFSLEFPLYVLEKNPSWFEVQTNCSKCNQYLPYKEMYSDTKWHFTCPECWEKYI